MACKRCNAKDVPVQKRSRSVPIHSLKDWNKLVQRWLRAYG